MAHTSPLLTIRPTFLGQLSLRLTGVLGLLRALARWTVSFQAPAGHRLPAASPAMPKPPVRRKVLKTRPRTLGPALTADHSPLSAMRAILSECVVADLETTGLSPETEDIIEVGAWRLSAQGRVIGKMTVLVKPRRSIPAHITQLTGITDAMVQADGVSLDEALQGLYSFAGETPVLFHNANFDTRFLVAAAERTGQALPVLQTRDTLGLARHMWPHLSSHRLEVVSEHLDGPIPGHRVSSDLAAMQALVVAAAQSLREALQARQQAAQAAAAT